MIEYYNEDCMEGMKWYGDKHFDLAIVDPICYQTIQKARSEE